MDIKERKNRLIDWLDNLKNEALINRIEELKEESQMDVPNEIISLLDSSNAADQSDLVVHTKTRHL